MLKRKMSKRGGRTTIVFPLLRQLLAALAFLLTLAAFFILLPPGDDANPSRLCEQAHRNHQLQECLEEYMATTCSQQAFRLGRGQKVIAFTYFSKSRSDSKEISRHYVEGIRGNLEAMTQIYGHEWTMRLYHNLAENDELLEHELLPLIQDHPEQFVLCDVNRNPLLGNVSVLWPPTLWRFLPLLDNQVDVALFRDLDSRPTHREFDAVQEWMQSKHIVHVMRDHPAHDMPILAGMWGVKLGTKPNVREALSEIFLEIMKRGSSYLNWSDQGGQREVSSEDQALLERYLWPWAKSLVLQHDSYHCDLFAKSHPWPSQRLEKEPNNFVGAAVALQSTLQQPCPVKCRPREHPDWRFC